MRAKRCGLCTTAATTTTGTSTTATTTTPPCAHTTPPRAVKGYAWSGGGRDIIRVDVSTDGGATWAPAALAKPPGNAPGRAWGMTLFSARLPLPEGAGGGGGFEIVAKATDESYNTQPESPAAIWNVRGLVNNAWHRVCVRVGDGDE